MAELTAQTLSGTAWLEIDTNVDQKSTPNIGGDYFTLTGGGTYIIVATNTNVAARTITVQCDKACSYHATTLHDVTMTLAQNDTGIISQISSSRFKDGDGRVQLTYDAVADLTIKVLKVPFGD